MDEKELNTLNASLRMAVIQGNTKEVQSIIEAGATAHKNPNLLLVELATLLGHQETARALIREEAIIQPSFKEINYRLNLSAPENISFVKKYLGEEYADRNSPYLGQDDGMEETFEISGRRVSGEKFDANLGLVAASNLVSDVAALKKEVDNHKKEAELNRELESPKTVTATAVESPILVRKQISKESKVSPQVKKKLHSSVQETYTNSNVKKATPSSHVRPQAIKKEIKSERNFRF